ncbi:hypothetical protein BC941DRAFT_438404 [Chlamydoabsidia padenii]|nr:hypothetical protein BC941DRAFT_438404 [Chlamydoabsidia padenii]
MTTDYQVKGVFNKFKQAVHYYNVMESKVLQATNTDAWGAPSSLLRSLADGTRETDKLNVIMPSLYRRLTVKDTRQWLQIYKALVLLEYLVKYGDDQVLPFVQSHQEVLVTLQSFEFLDEKGQDKGYNVRIRSKTVQDLINSPEEIKRIRETSRLSQDRFIGVGSNDITTTTPTTPTTPTTEENNSSPPLTKKLPPIDHPLPAIMKEEEEAEDDMDNVIFREDFIDPLDEDNHAMVFPPAGGKGKAATLSVDELTDDEQEDEDDTKKKKKNKKTTKSKKESAVEPPIETKEIKEPKKKSRFSLTGVFSRSKPSVPVEEPPQQTSEVAVDTSNKEVVVNTSNIQDTVDDNEEGDGWGDFASPDQGTDLLDEESKQKEYDLLDLDCDIMTASSTRTSVDHNDLLLLDMPTCDISYVNTQYNPYSTPMMKNNPVYNQPSQVSPMNSVETPTTPFDFDPLGYAGLSTSPQQLTQHWYPWMATNTPYQKPHHQQGPLTVDDLLS